MSLINQMLQDLESRSKQRVDPAVALMGLGVSKKHRLEFPIKKYILFFGIFILITLCIYQSIHFFYRHNRTIPKTKESSITTKIAGSTVLAAPSISTSTLTGIALQVEPTLTNLRFLVNHETLYTINTNKQHNKLILTFINTELVADLPALNYLNSAIQDLEIASSKDGNLIVSLTLQPDSEIKMLDWVGTKKSPELRLDIALKAAIQSPVISNQFTKKPVVNFNIDQQYKNALNLIADEQNFQAKKVLFELLEKYPDFLPARATLVEILLESGDKKLAEKILVYGIKVQPAYPPFLKLKAHVLVSQGKLESALRVLESTEPNILEYPDYYGFMAALYQQTDRPKIAAQLYEKLLQLEPSKATWWAGYGISLESIGRPSEAKNAYQHAQTSNGLNNGLTKELQNYIEDRLNSV